MAELDPDIAAVLADMSAAGLAPYEGMTAAEARAANTARNRYWNEEPPAVGAFAKLEVPGPRRPLEGWFYRPAVAQQRPGVILFLHGGGWVFGSPETHDGLARRLANAAGFPLLSLHYGLAPEEPYPQGLDDALAAIAWLRAGPPGLDLDASRLALVGDSAGANLALAACLKLRDAGQPAACAAALIYGAYSGEFDGSSGMAFGDGRHVLSRSAMEWFWRHYVGDAVGSDGYACPLYADLRGLPPLFLGAAEFDPLRDHTERLARRLLENGVAFDYRLWQGLTHASMNWSRRVRRVPPIIDEIGAFLGRQLDPATASKGSLLGR